MASKCTAFGTVTSICSMNLTNKKSKYQMSNADNTYIYIYIYIYINKAIFEVKRSKANAGKVFKI
jgi:hypothetical protein